jgi:hypothetical protein
MLSQSVIHILVDSFSILFNLWFLVNPLIRKSSFTRGEVVVSVAFASAVVYWTLRLVSDIRKERYSRRIADLDKGYEYLQKIIMELHQDADDIRGMMKGLAKREKRQPRSSSPDKEQDSQKKLFP